MLYLYYIYILYAVPFIFILHYVWYYDYQCIRAALHIHTACMYVVHILVCWTVVCNQHPPLRLANSVGWNLFIYIHRKEAKTSWDVVDILSELLRVLISGTNCLWLCPSACEPPSWLIEQYKTHWARITFNLFINRLSSGFGSFSGSFSQLFSFFIRVCCPQGLYYFLP